MNLVRVHTVTWSDTRTEADDEGGAVLRRELEHAGFTLVGHSIVRESSAEIRSTLVELTARADVDAIVTTGGTGLGPRDRTIEVLEELWDKRMVGFGEAFRRASWEQVGPRSLLSNAAGGVVRGKLVFALPGSVKALPLAVELFAPILGHAVDLTQGRTGHGRPSPVRPGGNA